MESINVFLADCTDFDNEGLGTLHPKDWTFDEVANGQSVVTLTIANDASSGAHLIEHERIIRCAVPVRAVPEIQEGAVISSVEVGVVLDGATKSERALMSAATGGRKMATLPPGEEVYILESWQDRYRVQTAKYGTGFMNPDALRTSIREVDYDEALDEMEAEITVRPQLFRVRSIKGAGTDVLTVEAWHIFYDLEGEAPLEVQGAGSPVQDFVTLFNEYVVAQLDFHLTTDQSGTWANWVFPYWSPVKMLLDENVGFISRFGGGIVRDNMLIAMLRTPGRDRGLHIRYARNLIGVKSYEVDYDVTTRIIAVGTDAHGWEIYEVVDSLHAADYVLEHAKRLEVSNGKVGKDVTEEMARARMREAAEAEFAKGVDVPSVSLEVEFAMLGDSDEYAAYKALEQCYLYDTVHVWHPRIGEEVAMQVTEVEYDGPKQRLTRIVLGKRPKGLEAM